jgi:hypothetical protein
MSLDSSHRDLSSGTNCVITGVLMRHWDLFIFFTLLSLIFFHKLQGGERKQRNKKKTLEAHQNSNNDITGIVRKISTK